MTTRDFNPRCTTMLFFRHNFKNKARVLWKLAINRIFITQVYAEQRIGPVAVKCENGEA